MSAAQSGKKVTGDSLLSTYQIIEALSQCGSGKFFLARHKQHGFLCVLRDFGQDFGRKETSQVLREMFEDVVRMYTKLYEVKLLRHFEHGIGEGQLMIAVDAESVDWMCVHINKEKLQRRLKELRAGDEHKSDQPAAEQMAQPQPDSAG